MTTESAKVITDRDFPIGPAYARQHIRVTWHGGRIAIVAQIGRASYAPEFLHPRWTALTDYQLAQLAAQNFAAAHDWPLKWHGAQVTDHEWIFAWDHAEYTEAQA